MKSENQRRTRSAVRKIPVSLLRPGMVLYRPVFGPDGQLWLNAGVELKSKYITSLWRAGISFVFISDPLLSDVLVTEVVSEETRRQAVKAVKETLKTAKLTKQNSLLIDKRFSSIVEKLVREVLASKDVLINLADIRDVDDYTFLHSVNVCVLSLLNAADSDLSQARLEELGGGALLHDLGKIWISEFTLKKKGSLTPEEYHEVKKHPTFGFEILTSQANYSPNSAKVVAQHHERCDGSGYPYNLEKDDIHFYARLVMIADVYDALTADRPYRLGMKPHKAIEIITDCAESYDRPLVDSFLKHIAPYPVGTALRLSNGHLGIVIQNRKEMPLQPVVRIFKNRDGFLYREPFDLDLSDKPNLQISDVLNDAESELELPVMIKHRKDVIKWQPK